MSLRTILGYAKLAADAFRTFSFVVVGGFRLILTVSNAVSNAIEYLTGIPVSPLGLLAALMFFNWITALQAIELALGAVAFVLSGISSALGIVITTFGAPWLLAIAGISVALYELYKNWDLIKQGWHDGISAVTGWFRSQWEGAINWLSSKLESLMKLWNSLTCSTASSASSSSSATGYASGGYVRGPGTGTSDSVQASLSNGEYVLNARATSAIGVSRLNVLNSIGSGLRMATGGFVGSMPSFASSVAGNTASTPRTSVTLQINGETFADMLTPRAVAEKLVRFASNKQACSMGVRPSWFR